MGQLTQHEMTSCNDGEKRTCTLHVCVLGVVHVRSTRGACEGRADRRIRECGILRDIDLVGFCYDGTI